MIKLRVGDTVEWGSSAHGRRKRGSVVGVIPPGYIPNGVRDPGKPRDHESYLLSERGPIKDGSKTVSGREFFWPLVQSIRIIASEDSLHALAERFAMAKPPAGSDLARLMVINARLVEERNALLREREKLLAEKQCSCPE